MFVKWMTAEIGKCFKRTHIAYSGIFISLIPALWDRFRNLDNNWILASIQNLN